MIVSSQVRRDDRADVDVQGLPRAPGRRRALRRGHRPGLRARGARRPSNGFREVFYGDPDIGGRYSALSPFGLVPAAARGHRRRRGARLRDRRRRGVPRASSGNAGLWLGCALGELARQGRDKLTFVADAPLDSLRRLGRAAVRRVHRQAGPRHPADRRRAAARRPRPTATTASSCTSRSTTPTTPSKLAALKDAGHPVITIRALGPTDLGRIFFLSEFAVAVAGWALEINPFDQPNVQEAKDNTNRVLKEGSGDLDDGQPERADRRPRSRPRYFAIMGYLPYSDETEARDRAPARGARSSEYHVATTWGYGPRFLHSTGQFHKGGPKTGRFLQLIDEPAEDLEIPGEPYTFGTLIRAQADGDLQTLRNHGLPAVRITRRRHRRDQGAALACRSDSSASARWAATWSIASSATRTTRSSPSTRTRTPSRPPRSTARSARPRSRSSSPSSTRRGWSG